MATEMQRNEMKQAVMAEIARRREHRKEWQAGMEQADEEQAAGRALPLPASGIPDTSAARRELINAAMNGEAALEAQALACIRAYPAETVLGWANPKETCLNLVSPAEATEGGRVVRAVIADEYNLKLTQIEGDNPTPLERLLAERITVLRFQLTHFERLYQSKSGGGLPLDLSEHHLKRIDRVNKQYVRAIESLARVRRLQLPAVTVGQMNIGERQINMAEKQINVCAGGR